MTHQRIGPLTAYQLRTLVAILAPYRAEPVTPAVIALAVRLARLTAPHPIVTALATPRVYR